MLNRRGVTLVELLVALVLAAIVLGSATSSLVRQQHTHTQLRATTNADLQTRASLAVLGGQLVLLNTADITDGQASDTAIQLRAPVGASIACGEGRASVTLAPDSDPTRAIGGTASLPSMGDSLWWRADSTWSGAEITGTAQTSVTCFGATGATTKVSISRPDTIPDGSALRITRATRYGVYKSGDGTWQLGFREWSAASNSFASPQPIAGPLVQKPGTRRSGFRYFDGNGVELPIIAGSADVSRVARIRITAHSLMTVRERGQDSVRSDSIDVALASVRVP